MNRCIVAALCWALAGTAVAQAPTRIRANVVAFDGKLLTVKTALGKEIKLRVTDQTSISYPRALKLSDIKPGSYIGSAAMPGPDGKLVAREVHVFPESQRGTGDGHRPWSGAPGATMTNGGVSQSVKAVNGEELTVQYQGGVKTIVVREGTPIVTNVPGDRSLLVPGAYVVVLAQGAEGALVVQRIQATSKDGVRPPG